MTNICLRQIQKLGAFAIFVTSLTLANAAQAISFSSTLGTYSIPDNDPTGVSVTISNISDPSLIFSFNSITISGFTHPAYGDLRASLSNGIVTVQLFQSSYSPDNASISDPTASLVSGGGNYTFTYPTGADWNSQSPVVPDNIVYSSFDDLGSFNNQALNSNWTLNVQDVSSINSTIGSFTQFSFDVTPVPFEFEPSIGLSILGGAWLLRRHLKKNETKV